MTDEAPLFVLPVLEDEARNEAFHKHVVDLAGLLVETIINDTGNRLANPDGVQSTAQSIGAAIYTTLRVVQKQYSEDDPRHNGIRQGFFAAFVVNDEDWKATELAEYFRNNDNVGSA